MSKRDRRKEIDELRSNEKTRFAVSPGAGLLRPAAQCPSPNQDERPDGAEPELVIIHGISLPPGEFGGPHIEALFTNCLDPEAHAYFREIDGLRVSAHLLIQRDGDVVQFVPFGRRAWHAGDSRFRGRRTCNDFSIGIELEGTDDEHACSYEFDVPIVVSTAMSESGASPNRSCTFSLARSIF